MVEDGSKIRKTEELWVIRVVFLICLLTKYLVSEYSGCSILLQMGDLVTLITLLYVSSHC